MEAIKILGDYWTLRIIDRLGEGEIRFCDLQRAVDNCNPVTLTNRLKKLEETGLVSRIADPDEKNCVTYKLTGRGQDALPVIAAIDTFAKKSQSVGARLNS
jgi:DNA-binding HxlR family transcriptional regulator